MNTKANILVLGLTESLGGVEIFILTILQNIDLKKVQFDFLMYRGTNIVFRDAIEDIYCPENHLYFLPNMKRHPLRCFSKMLSFYRANGKKYDYVHVHTGSTANIIYCYPWIRLFGKAKIIAHSHNSSSSHSTKQAIFRPLMNRASDIKLACSAEAANWLFGKRGAAKARFIPNGIDIERFTFDLAKRIEARVAYGLGDDLVVGHVGRFSHQKNHQFLIKAFAELHRQNPNTKLLLAGTGEDLECVQRQVRALSLDNAVVFAGVVADLSNLYCAMDVFVLPSLYEGLPITGIEAQACGLPCLFSDTITQSAAITPTTQYAALSERPLAWANRISAMAQMQYDRATYCNLVKQSGYDQETTVRVIEKLYLS